MAKNFEIRYAPDQWGNQYTNTGGAFGGLHVQAPANQLSPNFSPNLADVMLRNNQIRSRLAFTNLIQYTGGGSSGICLVGSFSDLSQNYHTFAWTNAGLFEIQGTSLVLVSASIVAGQRCAWWVVDNILYLTMAAGSTTVAHTSAWDGTNVKVDVAYTGTGASQVDIGAYFIGDLDQHIILAATAESAANQATPATFYPQRVRWSNVAWNAGANFANIGTTAATFDPTVNVNAGFNDFVDVPDAITGLLMLGRVGYIIRSGGITELSPTGNGLAPFDFNHLWAAQHGIGSIHPDTVAQYGNMGIFVAEDNVYMITPSETRPIGGAARDAIWADLAPFPPSFIENDAFGVYAAAPVANIIPRWSRGFVYLTYVLVLPPPNGSDTSTMYLYSIEDNNWVRWTVPNSNFTCAPSTCWSTK